MLRKLVIFVVGVHLLAIASLTLSFTPKRSSVKHLTVHTEKLRPAPPAAKRAVASGKKPSNVPQKPKPTPSKPTKKVAKPKSPAKAPEKKSAPVPKESGVEEELQELSRVLEGLQEKKNLPSSHKMVVPSTIGTLESGSCSGFEESLAEYLQQALRLPEYGQVRVRLTLKPDGSFVKMQVLAAESQKNRAFLEANLPLLQFPRFEGKEREFILTVCNAW